jgi:hypothetical protein
MSCFHGNPEGHCDICDEIDIAWNNGARSADKRLEKAKEAMQAMIDCTGGSRYWDGKTHKALKLIEAALAELEA